MREQVAAIRREVSAASRLKELSKKKTAPIPAKMEIQRESIGQDYQKIIKMRGKQHADLDYLEELLEKESLPPLPVVAQRRLAALQKTAHAALGRQEDVRREYGKLAAKQEKQRARLEALHATLREEMGMHERGNHD